MGQLIFEITAIFKNSALSFFIWMIVGLIPFFWFPTFKQKALKQDELEKISSKFAGINIRFWIGYFLSFLIICYIFWGNLLKINLWSIKTYGVGFYPYAILFFISMNLFADIFGLFEGVYPLGKSTTYIYDEPAVIRQVLLRHLLTQLGIIALSFLFFYFLIWLLL